MTENEAIKVLITQKQCIDKSSSGQCKIHCGDCKKNIPIAYQEKSYEEAIIALKEIQRYREIGTVEECREAVEKQKPKKPDYEGDGYDDKGELVYDTWICPNCDKKYEVDYDDYKHCPNCGQSIDENLEGMEDE